MTALIAFIAVCTMVCMMSVGLCIMLALSIKPPMRKEKPPEPQAAPAPPEAASGKPPIEKQWEDFYAYDGKPKGYSDD